MAYLTDTNILTRSAQPQAPEYPVVARAVTTLLSRGEILYVCAQNIIEFWAVATRPAGPPSNGLGLTPAQAEHEIQEILNTFWFIPDPNTVYQMWHQLVVPLNVMGKQAHDARLAALMRVAGIPNLLTFNVKDFARYPGITVVDPKDV